MKEQVKRNIERFPERYIFELTKEEAEVSRSQNATLKRGENIKYLPYAFTEHGVLQLSNVLKSKKAITVSLKIIDVFIQLREILANHTELRIEVEKIKRKLDNQDKNMEVVYKYLDELLEKKENPKPRIQIGYKIKKKKQSTAPASHLAKPIARTLLQGVPGTTLLLEPLQVLFHLQIYDSYYICKLRFQ